MIGFVMFLHAIVCILVVTIVLMQSGRGGGLTEAFSSAESMFGAKTNEMLIKATTVVTICFFVTSITLAILSAKRGKSLMTDGKVSKVVDTEKTEEATDAVAEAASDVAEKVVDSVPAAPVTEKPATADVPIVAE